MSKKQWIKFKRGLFKDPKHRKAMGEAIWLYGDLIDVADWTTGKVDGFKDQEWADEMDISKAWVRKHRRKLEKAGYISAEQHGSRGMTITIHKWINPRMESGTDRPLQGDTNVPPVGDTDVPPFIEGGTTGGTDVPLSQAQNEYASILPIDHIPTTTEDSVKPGRPRDLLFDAIVKVCNLSPKINGSYIGKTKKALVEMGKTPEDLYAFQEWWYQNDWRGQKGQAPSQNQLITEIEKAKQAAKRNGNGVHPDKGDGQINPDLAEWARRVKQAEREARDAA
jgi:hypothetical protein